MRYISVKLTPDANKFLHLFLSVKVVCLYVGCDFRLPLVADAQQLLFVVQQLFVRLGGVLEIGALRKKYAFLKVCSDDATLPLGTRDSVPRSKVASSGQTFSLKGRG